jgi:hypothetical protein
MSDKRPKLGSPVWILNCDEQPERHGVFCGVAAYTDERGEAQAAALVRLDEGFYSPDPATYVTMLPVDWHYISTEQPRYFLADENHKRVPGFGARASEGALKAHVLEKLNEDRADREEPPYPDWATVMEVFEDKGWIILESEDD